MSTQDVVPIIPSLCIPRAFSNITEARIRKIFGELQLGEIMRMDIISRTTEKGEKFNRIFVHFSSWYDNPNAKLARERLLNGKEIKIIYDDPWFWKVSAYQKNQQSYPKAVPKTSVPKAHIEFDEDTRPLRQDTRPLTRPLRQDTRPPRQDTRPPRQDTRPPRQDTRPPRQDTRPPNNIIKEV